MPAINSHAYTQAYEANRSMMEDVVVFPSSFFSAIKNVRASQGLIPSSLEAFRKAHTFISGYDDKIWTSNLILIPGLYEGRWTLFAVCNASLAKSKASVPPPCQTIEPGELRPDANKFAVLSMSAWGETPERLRKLITLFLEFHYGLIHDDDLQYVDGWEAAVRLTDQPHAIVYNTNDMVISVLSVSTTLLARCMWFDMQRCS